MGDGREGLPFAVCCFVCHLPLATCHLPLATCHLPLATCHLPLATRHLHLGSASASTHMNDDSYNDGNPNHAGGQGSPQQFHVLPTLLSHFPPLPAPAHPTDLLQPFTTGSTSELFRAIVKKPAPISIEINDELHSNASDVALQFAAELRVYSKVGKNTGFAAFLGCVEGLGIVLEWVEGRTLFDAVRGVPAGQSVHEVDDSVLDAHKPSDRRKIKWYNQLVDALTHLHSFGLNHGDLSMLNIYIETRTDNVKLIDFGRSVSVEGYPCEHLYIEPKAPTPKPRSPSPKPVVFKPGGAWVDAPPPPNPKMRLGHSRPGLDGGRPKLFDRSSTPAWPPATPGLESNLPGTSTPHTRPQMHASRLLSDHRPPFYGHQHSSSSSSALVGGAHTHMPIYAPRGRQMASQSDVLSIPGLRSRQASASPARTHHHLASSPMSSRYTPRPGSIDLSAEEEDAMYTNGVGEEDWTRVASEVYGSSASLAKSMSVRGHGYASVRTSRHPSRERYSRDPSPHYPHTPLRGPYMAYEPPPPRKPIKEPEKIHPCTPPFCAPEIMRDECEDPILADAYSFGIVMLCMDLGDLVRIEAWKQKKEE
jgi:serine/threonine protein kinase